VHCSWLLGFKFVFEFIRLLSFRNAKPFLLLSVDLKASSKKRGAQPILATQLAQAGPAQPPTGGDHLSSPTSNRDRELDSRPRVRAALRPAPPARLGASTWPYIMRLRTTRPLTPQTLAAIELSGAAPTLATSPPLFFLTVDSPPPRRAPGALRGGS
jgi:hypothetical protein